MPSRAPLRAVGPDDSPPAVKPPKTITEAAERGSHRELLVTLRARVATAVEDPNCPPRDLAALTRRLQEIAKEIEAIDAREQDDPEGEAVQDGEFDASAV